MFTCAVILLCPADVIFASALGFIFPSVLSKQSSPTLAYAYSSGARHQIIVAQASEISLDTPPTAASKAPVESTTGKAKAGVVTAVSKDELALLKKLDANYQKQSSKMSVKRVTKETLLERTRTEEGTLWLSAGRLRMELNGEHKSVLIVNKKRLWAITYPPAEFKDAKIQVITGETTNSKSRSQSFITLLSQGGFLKFFMATGARKDKNGQVVFFLSPKEAQTAFRRAELTLSFNGKNLESLIYWDDRDNETRMDFTNAKATAIANDLFTYDPPADADLMKL